MLNQKTPEMYLVNPNRQTVYGAVKGTVEFNEDIRFGTCSEINFTVPKRFYDIETESWIDNIVYNKLVKGNLIYVADDTNYYEFPNRTIGNYSFYGFNINEMIGRINNLNSMTCPNDGLSHFVLQPETRLFNISLESGYNWHNLAKISDGAYLRYSNWLNYFPFVACPDFIPINSYDVISVKCRTQQGAWLDNKDSLPPNIRFRAYYIHFYTTPEASSYVGTIGMGWNVSNPVERLSINSLNITHGNSALTIKEKLANGGYIRISVEDNRYLVRNDDPITYNDDYSSYYVVDGNTTRMAWSFPYDSWLQIYSGERRCISIDNENRNGTYKLPLHWFVIDSVDEDNDGIMPLKTIKCMSYEYYLSNRTVSIDKDTYAFYIPDRILQIVNSNNWAIDKKTRDINNDMIVNTTGSQYMKTGLLNKILEVLPHWRIGHISQELMTRYREFDDVDNSDIYSFLTNDVAKAYQCYFVFDCDNLTISAYSQNDIIQNSNVTLTWDNSIKRIQVSGSSVNKVTALRVHTANDLYGLGLVNPFGGSTIYNFDSVIDQMDFIADTSTDDPLRRNEIRDENDNFIRFRTLKEAVEKMVNFSKNPSTRFLYPNSIKPFTTSGVKVDGLDGDYIRDLNKGGYRGFAKMFVDSNLSYVKALSALQDRVTDYHVVADKINVYLETDFPDSYESKMITDKIPVGTEMTPQSSYENWHSQKLYNELMSAKINYWNAYFEVRESEVNSKIDDGMGGRLSLYTQNIRFKNMLSHVAQQLNLNYYRQKELKQKYPQTIIDGELINLLEGTDLEYSILTPNEILALQPFIVEGDWTNENAVFSDTYGADDIILTLVDVMEEAENNLSNIYSKDNYDFEADMINWLSIIEMQSQAKNIRVGQTVLLNTDEDHWIRPMLLELHKNYIDKDDFKITFTTDYKRKVTQFRFSDLYNSINKVSISNNTFTFDE